MGRDYKKYDSYRDTISDNVVERGLIFSMIADLIGKHAIHVALYYIVHHCREARCCACGTKEHITENVVYIWQYKLVWGRRG